jgi:hypothetical protein
MDSETGEYVSGMTIRDAKRTVSRQFLGLPGVSGVGIEADESGGERIKVYLAHDDPNLASAIPADVDGFPVVSEVIGPIRPR